MDYLIIGKIAVCAFFAVLFLQSGADKVSDRTGNLSWMVPHFERSPFKTAVPLLLTVLTVCELACGVLSLVAIPAFFVPALSGIGGWAMSAVLATLLMLFAGQRLAKDYVGAASLAGYFAVAVLGIMVM